MSIPNVTLERRSLSSPPFIYMEFCVYHEGCVRPEVVWRSTGLGEQWNKRRAEGMLSVALNELEHVRVGEEKDPIDERTPFSMTALRNI